MKVNIQIIPHVVVVLGFAAARASQVSAFPKVGGKIHADYKIGKRSLLQEMKFRQLEIEVIKISSTIKNSL